MIHREESHWIMSGESNGYCCSLLFYLPAKTDWAIGNSGFINIFVTTPLISRHYSVRYLSFQRILIGYHHSSCLKHHSRDQIYVTEDSGGIPIPRRQTRATRGLTQYTRYHLDKIGNTSAHRFSYLNLTYRNITL